MGNLPICHCQLCWAEAMFQVIQLLNFRPIYVEITSKPAPIHAVEKSALKIDAKNVKKLLFIQGYGRFFTKKLCKRTEFSRVIKNG